MSQNFWNAEDTAFLIANYATMTKKELAERLGRKYKGITAKAKLIGLEPTQDGPGRPRSKMTPEERRAANLASKKRSYRKARGLAPDAVLKMGGSNAWTDEQVAFLKANWLKMTEAELAESIGRSRRAIANKGAVLKLPKKATGGARPSSRPSHPKPVVKAEATVEQFIAARAKMKSKPGPMSLGWRMRSWR